MGSNVSAFDQSKAIQQYLEKSKDLSSKRYTTCFGHTFVYPCKLTENSGSLEKVRQAILGHIVKAHDSHPDIIGKFLTSKSFIEQVDDLWKITADKAHHTSALLENMKKIKDLYLGCTKEETGSPDLQLKKFNAIIESVQSSETSTLLPDLQLKEFNVTIESVQSSETSTLLLAPDDLLNDFGFRIDKMNDPQSVLEEYSLLSNSIRDAKSYSEVDKAVVCSALYKKCEEKFSKELDKALKMIALSEGNSKNYVTQLKASINTSKLQADEKEGLINLILSKK